MGAYNPSILKEPMLQFIGGSILIYETATNYIGCWCQWCYQQNFHYALSLISFPSLTKIYGSITIQIDHGAYSSYPLLSVFFPALLFSQGGISVTSPDACSVAGCNGGCNAASFAPRYMVVTFSSLQYVNGQLIIVSAVNALLDTLMTVNGPLSLTASSGISLTLLSSVSGLIQLSSSTLYMPALTYVGSSLSMLVTSMACNVIIDLLPSISGSLTLTGAAASLSMFALGTISGALTVTCNGVVSMNNLNYVGGNALVTANSVVFGVLTTIQGKLSLNSAVVPVMPLLFFILGSVTFNVGSGVMNLNSLTSVGGTLTVTGLNTTMILPALSYMLAPASIVLRGSFMNVGFPNLTIVSGNIDVSCTLSGLLSFPLVTQITGSVIFTSSSIGNVSIPMVSTITGSVTLTAIQILPSFILPALITIQGAQLFMVNISNMTYISFPVLTSLAGNLAITNAPMLTNVVANSLATAGTFIQMCSNIILAQSNVSLSIRNLAGARLSSGSCNEVCFLNCSCILFGC